MQNISYQIWTHCKHGYWLLHETVSTLKQARKIKRAKCILGQNKHKIVIQKVIETRKVTIVH